MFTKKISCSKSLSRAAQKIRVIRVIRVQKNLVSPFPAQRRKFVSFEKFVFKKNPVFKVPFPRSAEHSCHSSYSCSKEKSRVQRKNLVFTSLSRAAWNIRVIRVIRVQKKNPVFTRKLFVFPSACKNNKNPLTLQAKMRKITHIIIHCTATRADRSFSVQSLEASHKARGFLTIGYHYYITRDGQVHPCRPESMIGAHAQHHNAHSIGICYEGGLDARGLPADTRTDAQKRSMAALLRSLRLDYPDASIIGHRDLPGVKKACPCFDVKAWLPSIGLHR